MVATIRLFALTAAAVLAPVLAFDPAGFGLWTSKDLRQHEETLSTRVGPDHSARETLAAYEGHRFRMLYRDRDGVPEQHDREIDVVIVEGGEATLVVGGEMVEPRVGADPGEWLGTSIAGGDEHPVAAGDLIHIPPKTPHRFLVPEGGHITYVIVKLPAS
jgi:hypothetical protein